MQAADILQIVSNSTSLLYYITQDSCQPPVQVFTGERSERSSNKETSSPESSPAKSKHAAAPHRLPTANGRTECDSTPAAANGQASPTANGHADDNHESLANGHTSPGLLGHQPPWVLDAMADLLLTHFDFEEAPLARAAIFEVSHLGSLLPMSAVHAALQLLGSSQQPLLPWLIGE